MDFRICGRVQVRLDGDPPPEWRSTKVRGLLGALLTNAGKTVLTSTLVEWLWGPGEDPQHPPKSLLNHVSRLRTVLRQMTPPHTVERTEHGYRIDAERDDVDYHRARLLLSRGRTALRNGNHGHARELLQEAADLAEQPPLLDLDTPKAAAFRREAEQNLLLPLLNSLAEAHLGLGEPESVLALLDELPSEYGLDVTLLKRRIDALRALHRHDDATGRYLSAYRALKEHGLDAEAADLRNYAQPAAPAVPSPRSPAENLPSYRATPQRLPHDRTDLVGRAQLLSTLDESTNGGDASKLVVLTGTAGIGKTALALHWAHLTRDKFPGGRLYVDLRGFSLQPSLDADALTRRLLQDFQSPADTLGDAEQRRVRLSQLLAGRHTLLLLDNLAEPQQISPLLDLVPDALVLVTSRQQHDHLATHWGADEIRVPTLSTADSASWLRTTIGSARAESEPAAFAALVNLSAGIPLALRIIGKYAHDRPRTGLSEVAEVLRSEHRLLSMGDSTPENTSLRAGFMLSYRNLREPTRALFRTIGLHPTSRFALGAVAALAGEAPADTRVLLDELIGANLLDQEQSQYTTHDLIHEFAADLAGSPEEPADRGAPVRLFRWYFDTARNAARTIAPHKDPIPPLEHTIPVQSDEFADEHEAFRWLLENRNALLAIVRTAHRSGHDAYAWRIANLISGPLKRHGSYLDVRTTLEIAHAAAQRCGDLAGVSGSLNNLGHVHLVLRDFTRAEQCFVRSHELFRRADSPAGSAIALHNLAAARLHTAGPEEAHNLYRQALDLATEHGLRDVRAGTLRRIGHLLLTQGLLSDAGVHLREALAAHQRVGNTRGIGETLSDLAELQLQREDPTAALDYAHRALAAHVDSHDRTTLPDTCRVLAAAHHARGDYRSAIEPAREAVRITWETGDLDQQARALDQLATSLYASGFRTAAVEGWTLADDLHRRLQNPQWTVTTARLRSLDLAGS